MRLYILLSVCIHYGMAAMAPFITPCRRTDSTCMVQSAQAALPVLAAGVPALGINPMDPMLLADVKADSAGLNMNFRNTTVKGLRNCKVMKLERNSTLHLELLCSVTMRGDYTLGGKLLFLPIEGDGRYRIRIHDILVKVLFDLYNKEVDGETYWHLRNFRHSNNVRTGVEYSFLNLFNGNKQLSDTIHQFANSNWREIFQEVAPPIVDATLRQIYHEIGKLFHNVPLNQLAID